MSLSMNYFRPSEADTEAAQDFTGKTVIPLCTSSFSEIDDSGNLLVDLAGTEDGQDGERFGQEWMKRMSRNG